ncbi:hypothetical protein [Marinilactibacillus psychrotolerans]|uniref:Yip1 domain-containing protein n=1 Tax=Marinilactibacillus psychrotolerans TaxID=191770 RepID=A0AAV3WX38_9LACT|nr:hypothetical protein [Marinilactibacillus psychrotolerans]GEL67092.1 hypothetical protein MPS01_12470 [Marinilactibacillus psychrotolerans]GEQ36237.1 hypothetical protein M132T_17450 [Marinilactibacillus psychrotolerans]SDC79542.1 hypothetical protein SAMN04488013_10999 [Marinilactibacillus psychrotolerans]
MNEEVEVNENKGFPWKALAVFVVVIIGVTLFNAFTMDTTDLGELEGNSGALLFGGAAVGSVFGAIGAIIVLSIQYAFTKFPTQWISKEENVYKYDIWSALFYSSAIGTIMNTLLQQLNMDANLIASSIVSILTTGLFLFFYFSGEEKEQHVKKAITIVQVAWLVIGLVLSAASVALLKNVGL